MDYVVGSVADLISGSITPNRPKLIRRALTPVKHQPSPNVTPKSEFVEDRSIFLSPSLQKKKAVAKKSPKRIFENPDLDVTNDGDGDTSMTSPKADKVKKHLKKDLEAEEMIPQTAEVKKSKRQNSKSPSPRKLVDSLMLDQYSKDLKKSDDSTPKKNKKKRNSLSYISQAEVSEVPAEDVVEASKPDNLNKSPKKKKNKLNLIKSPNNIEEDEKQSETLNETQNTKKGKKRKSSSLKMKPEDESTVQNQVQTNEANKKSKKKKKDKPNHEECHTNEKENLEGAIKTKVKKNKKNFVNPNAVTDKDSDSEHDSDDDIESENEESNKAVLDTGPAAESSDEEEEKQKKVEKPREFSETDRLEEEKRTLFVGNVPFSKKCKKEIKKIFAKYGAIESVRIRTIPVKDARVTPKLAVIRNELHPDRSTVNVYVKYVDASSVQEALVENNTVLNDHHLRVTRSSTSGDHDPRRSVFVGNLPFGIEDETLRATFEKCGQVESVRVVRDKKTNAGKGFGYVNFASKDGVELALALTDEDLTIKNRILRVKRCTQINNKYKTNTQNSNQRQNRPPNRQGNRPTSFNRQDRPGPNRPGNFKGDMRPGPNRPGNLKGDMRPGPNRPGNFKGGMRPGRNDGRVDRPGPGGFKGKGFGRPGDNGADGAYRRIMNKRKPQDGDGGPPNKRGNFNPPREKKPRKEFVGMTAEKKKKPNKFNKGNKKNKALSEILTKN